VLKQVVKFQTYSPDGATPFVFVVECNGAKLRWGEV